MTGKFVLVVVIFILCYLNQGLASNTPSPEPISVIPKPVRVEVGTEFFTITSKTKIVYFFSNKEMETTVKQFADRIHASTGYALAVMDGFNMPKRNFIFFDYIRDDSLGSEGYRLEVDKDKISVGANTDAGFFYAVQTIFQLLPPQIFSQTVVPRVRWRIPSVTITDKPRFSWRGMHLDVSRHFFPKEFIKTYIDMIAMHKMNTFHWHLTDDNGWRIEIKKYPKLAEVGAWRVDREDKDWNDRPPQKPGEKATYGGFYTQEEIKEIVKYAADRHVTIVPEIEMPAHTQEVLAAYPQLSCTGGPFTVPPGGVWPNTEIYCAGNDSIFLFLQDVLSEVIDLFPGKYIHVGGDEADKTEWKKCPKCQARIKQEGLKDESELQSYFIKRIEKFLIAKHRQLIGWDEILEGGLAPEATVMSWRGTEGGIAAARANHDVVMTPGSHCYFDYYQGAWASEPPAIGGYTPLSKVYQFEPVPESLNAEQSTHILGAQANVWSEFIPTPEHAQYMTMPRMAAMAEVLWSPKDSRNWDDFAGRVEAQMKRYEALNYNYAKSAYLVGIGTTLDSVRKAINITLKTELDSPEIRYTLDGQDPSENSQRYEQPIFIDKTSAVRAASFRNGKLLSKITEQKVFIHKGLFKPVRVKYPYEKYTAGGDLGLTNGIRGTKSFNDGNWQGYHQNDLEAVIDMGESTSISRITSGYLQNTGSWIFFPTSVEYLVSGDGNNFTSVAKFDQPVAVGNQDISIKDFSQEVRDVKARYIKVIAKNVGLCPPWHIGKGEQAWLFTDEIIIE
ncbi:MAG: family 20 glycosylhydrolase [Bacteroidota bacterium]